MGRGKMMSGLEFEGPQVEGEKGGIGSFLRNAIHSGIATSKVGLGCVASRTRKAAVGVAHKTKKTLYSLLSLVLTAVLVVSSSLFLYGTFYYAFMPKEIHEVDVNFQFEPCEDKMGVCSFPNASINFASKKHGLMNGQPYSINMLLEVPDSPQNQGIGMFMSCIRILTKSGKSIKNHCKSNILEYQSDLLRIIDTLVFSPFLMIGSTLQRQWIKINYFTDFIDDPHSPTQYIELELRSKFVQVYSASLQVHAEFSGLRSIMYNHPWLSTVVGVLSNILVLSSIILMSWARFIAPEQDKYEEEEQLEEELISDDFEETEEKKDQ